MLESWVEKAQGHIGEIEKHYHLAADDHFSKTDKFRNMDERGLDDHFEDVVASLQSETDKLTKKFGIL